MEIRLTRVLAERRHWPLIHTDGHGFRRTPRPPSGVPRFAISRAMEIRLTRVLAGRYWPRIDMDGQGFRRTPRPPSGVPRFAISRVMEIRLTRVLGGRDWPRIDMDGQGFRRTPRPPSGVPRFAISRVMEIRLTRVLVEEIGHGFTQMDTDQKAPHKSVCISVHQWLIEFLFLGSLQTTFAPRLGPPPSGC